MQIARAKQDRHYSTVGRHFSLWLGLLLFDSEQIGTFGAPPS